MTSKNKTNNDFMEEHGFTLVEVLVTVVIIGIISAIAVPSVIGIVDNAKEEVCLANRIEFKRNYMVFIQLKEIQDSPVVFKEFLSRYDEEMCPEHGVITYEDGDVMCSDHSESGEEDKSEDVPFL